MNRMNTATVGLAVTPTVLQTFVSHYLNRKPLHQRPTAHLSYDEGLHLIRSFLAYVSQHTVEDVQAFTAQWVPHPQWIKLDDIAVPQTELDHAARLLEAQLGPEGIRKIGGRKWWQWRRPEAEQLKAEWIEMRSDYNARRKGNDAGKRVMLYVHGGAYFFGSVDMHRYQMQRHARKLKARVFAPDYRLSPQFPFPCGLQDCLAAYLHLLTVQEPNTIVLAGDSAGGGMVVSMLVILRDQGIPLPAGAILISPWCDLTHSFPSVAADAPFDYIPQYGFHHKPSAAWPPPNDDEVEELKKLALEEKKRLQPQTDGEESQSSPTSNDIATASRTHLTVVIDGQTVEVKEQIQMYANNELISHPLVSPIMQPTLGGLPPLLVMVGGGEILRDEQIYLAHKCANPSKYLPPEHTLDDKAREQINKYKPTDVQLQVWDDLCHVAPTLSFTRPAKYMYRSVAQFGAWALARAQKTEIEILDDDDISVISESTSDSDAEEARKKDEEANHQESKGLVGKAGDALPAFKNHMIRQRVTRHGVLFPLPPSSQLSGCTMDRDLVGVAKQGPVKKWLEKKQQWDQRFASTKKKVHKQFVKDLAVGYEGFGEGEFPPPSALAGRRKKEGATKMKKRKKSMGLAMWSLWGSKHDKMTMDREAEAEKNDKEIDVRPASSGGQGARPFLDIENQETAAPMSPRSRSRRRMVSYQNQDAESNGEGTPGLEFEKPPAEGEGTATPHVQFLSPDHQPEIGIGTSGKRAYVDGIAVPFRLKKEGAETASMMTLNSENSQALQSPRASTTRPMSSSTVEAVGGMGNGAMDLGESNSNGNGNHNDSKEGKAKDVEERPGLETFETAAENLPTIKGAGA